MILNPILKSIYIRMLYIIVSPIAYYMLYRVLFLICPSVEIHDTINGVWQFAISLIVIWVNIRQLAKPIQLCVIGTYLLFLAILIFWYKVGTLPTRFYDSPDANSIRIQLCNYRIMRSFYSVGFILLASILPIFLRTVQVPYLVQFGTIWIWTAILILDFVSAMPNIYYSDQIADRLYIGHRKVGNEWIPIYAIGNKNSPIYSVFLPQDSTHTDKRHYLARFYERQENILIQPETQDTIWIEREGTWWIPDRQIIVENNSDHLMCWQWQYSAWHDIKELFTNDHKK